MNFDRVVVLNNIIYFNYVEHYVLISHDYHVLDGK